MNDTVTDTPQVLLKHHLTKLRLPTFQSEKSTAGARALALSLGDRLLFTKRGEGGALSLCVRDWSRIAKNTCGLGSGEPSPTAASNYFI